MSKRKHTDGAQTKRRRRPIDVSVDERQEIAGIAGQRSRNGGVE